MKFIRQDVVGAADLAKEVGKFDMAFFGREDLDDRSRFSAPQTRSLARQSALVQYDPLRFELKIGDEVFRADELQDLPRKFPAATIALDATTMEFPEIALILRAYRRLAFASPRCVFIYTEPAEYVRRPTGEAAAPGSAFDLTLAFRAKNAIPAFTPMLSRGNKAHLVAFLGFEGARLSRVLSDDEGHFYTDVTVVFGIPPFQATWDMHALMANTRLIEQHSPSVRFSGANNPRSAYLLLQEVHRGLGGSQCNRLAVAPFGTKPAAIGAALYCVESDVMRAVYDHPERKAGRTNGVHRTHWFEVA
ncbi:MAG: hypothetical protein ABS39_03910 [Acidovorax sp. SCN 65-28]|uniref:hypothetical protein n=1 Tax=Acidovorax sp. TaxID=1872122 RepID=UPI0008693D6B|nr:hypothetical protein [Acidovorax sp.]MBN9626053.1 hypothetical protein [Acidovorax sp.]ODS79125.1 MAG: hypothetical protein ABS39_03910 [Acidovorax sp. SCN 65-28]